MQAMVLMSVLVVCVFAALLLGRRRRRTQTGPEDLGGSYTAPTTPTPSPLPAAASPTRAAKTPAPAMAAPAPVVPATPAPPIEPYAEQPVPAWIRRGHTNNGFARFGPATAQVRTEAGVLSPPR